MQQGGRTVSSLAVSRHRLQRAVMPASPLPSQFRGHSASVAREFALVWEPEAGSMRLHPVQARVSGLTAVSTAPAVAPSGSPSQAAAPPAPLMPSHEGEATRAVAAGQRSTLLGPRNQASGSGRGVSSMFVSRPRRQRRRPKPA